MDQKHPGVQLRIHRLTHLVEQRDLAKQLGVSVNCLSRLENGRTLPSLGFAFKIARYMGKTVDELFGPSFP